MNQRDSAPHSRPDRPESLRPAVHQNLPGIRLLDPGQDLHQGALAGTVFAQQGEHLSGIDAERHAMQRPYAGELLADLPGFENRLLGWRCVHPSSISSATAMLEIRLQADWKGLGRCKNEGSTSSETPGRQSHARREEGTMQRN
jgi:hypothetical protein